MSTLSLDSSVFNEKEPKKIIEFSANSIKAFLNIPSNAIVLILLFPVFAFAFLIINIMLLRILRKLKRVLGPLSSNAYSLSFEKASDVHQTLETSTAIFTPLIAEIEDAKKHWITRGVARKMDKLFTMLNNTRQIIAQTLFLSTENAESLTKEEADAFKYLNEVWGEDEDQIYARHTHYHLVKQFNKHENRSMECC